MMQRIIRLSPEGFDFILSLLNEDITGQPGFRLPVPAAMNGYNSHILLILQFAQITTRPTYSVGLQTQPMRQKNAQFTQNSSL